MKYFVILGIIGIFSSILIGFPYSDAFFEEGMVIEVPGQKMSISQNVISPGETMFVIGSFEQPVDNFTANIFKDYKNSNDLVLTLNLPSNEFGDFSFNFTIPQDWTGNYRMVLENGLQFMDGEFAVRTNHVGGSLDRTVYPVPWSMSPLKQIKSGTYGQDIQCRDDRVLVLKKSSELYSCIKPETVPKLFARGWALNEVRIINTDTMEYGKTIKITGVVDRLNTPEGFEYHLIPLREELPRIEYTGYDTLNLFSTKDTVHHFLRNLEGKLVEIEGNFLLDDGEYFRHFSGFPTVPVEQMKIISDNEDLKYSIDGAKIVSIVKVPDHMTLNIVLQEAKKGTLEITIPRDLIDAKIGEYDDAFFVLVDGIEVAFEEESNSTERMLTIAFEKDTRTIQVMGTSPL
ncbi:hypothetical protein [Candidatus Nitrosopumilus sediminis]|uniref:Blue (Type1) copper domain-containing protein n=1 Tax=Candidatus Nitrosopumilus sediminis TaxID=1229909 RepID=K0B8T2_9ARCH|nr:hypothetical protein [Candidatus Nitrosopumilus sediminis]AFS82598.1 hypothetical protein NSED_03960 [Candidatus Nitrosopumilus sediminis]